MSLANQNLCGRIRVKSDAKNSGFRLTAMNCCPLIPQDQVDQDDLDLGCGKEPAWAGMISMSKSKVSWASCDQLSDVLFARHLSHFQEAVTNEPFWLVVNLRVPVLLRRHSKQCPSG